MRDLPADVAQESPTWIPSQRTMSTNSSTSPWHRQLPVIDVSTLNAKQRLAYDIIKQHHTEVVAGDIPEPLRMLILGTAGTGKSYVICALANTCVLPGTTGMASFHVCGQTLHSALRLPIHSNNQCDLQGSSLRQLQLNLHGTHYIIVDDMSMIGPKMIARVDKRLRQASGKLNVPLGGFSLILIGDFGQPPPAGDKPLFAPPSTHPLSIHGSQIYQLFDKVLFLEQVLHQRGADPVTARF